MVILEIVGAEGKLPRIERISQNSVSIGRGYDNDIVLDDPYVDAHHLQLELNDEGLWHANDLNSENGTRLAQQVIQEADIPLGAELIIGKTHIRLLAPTEGVAPTLLLHGFEHYLLNFRSYKWMFSLVLSALALRCLTVYLTSTDSDIKFVEFFNAARDAVLGPIIIAALCSLIARLLRGESRFRPIFNLIMTVTIVAILFELVLNVIFYNFPSNDWRVFTQYLTNILVLTLVGYFILFLTTRLSNRARRVVAALSIIGFISSYAIKQNSVNDRFTNYPQYDGKVLPPMVLFRDGEDPKYFLSRLTNNFDEADQLALGEEE